jgi:hypothetical protein
VGTQIIHRIVCLLVVHAMQHAIEISNKLNIAFQNIVTVMMCVQKLMTDRPLSECLEISSMT